MFKLSSYLGIMRSVPEFLIPYMSCLYNTCRGVYYKGTVDYKVLTGILTKTRQHRAKLGTVTSLSPLSFFMRLIRKIETELI